jgi:hypothetical protein
MRSAMVSTKTGDITTKTALSPTGGPKRLSRASRNGKSVSLTSTESLLSRYFERCRPFLITGTKWDRCSSQRQAHRRREHCGQRWTQSNCNLYYALIKIGCMECVAEGTVKAIEIKTKEHGTQTSGSRSKPRTIILSLFCAYLVYQNATRNRVGASFDQPAQV